MWSTAGYICDGNIEGNKIRIGQESQNVLWNVILIVLFNDAGYCYDYKVSGIDEGIGTQQRRNDNN